MAHRGGRNGGGLDGFCSRNCSSKCSSISFSGRLRRAFKDRLKAVRLGLFWASFGASAKLPSCFVCSPLPSGVKRPKQAKNKLPAPTSINAPRRSKTRPECRQNHFRGLTKKLRPRRAPVLENPAARTQKKRPNQPPDIKKQPSKRPV